MQHKYTNNLIHETSPYLLQHAHNPVNWYAWNDETLALAKKENKLMLISVGYAACHWCHVMEHESFENDSVAKIMNDNFINIKIDREERPDIDQIYMTAVQLMTKSGGWPLNCVTLPDGRPFWGGTYFPKEEWTSTLTQIATLYKKDPAKVISYAENLTEGIQQAELVSYNSDEAKFTKSELETTVKNWSSYFDKDLGGMNSAPKFPMPNNYHFLLRYAEQTQDKNLKAYVHTTLEKMAFGGIFDQVGGGFARYSTDKKWHIPHFEKMLYDNAQLVSLYSDAYLISKNDLYKETVYRTLEFIEREMTNPEGGFYSSLDADSLNEDGELEEGAFYVWTEKELKEILKKDFDLFSKYYNVNDFGLWEHNKYNFIRTQNDNKFSKENNIDIQLLRSKVTTWQHTLLKERAKKNRPRLDDKTLSSWNALMLKGYIDAYRVFNDDNFLKIALKNANFLKEKQRRNDGGLNHNYKNGRSTINGYLEDYALVIEAYISLYEITLDQNWLTISQELTDYCYTHFYDKELQMFYFTSDEDQNLITRKMEINDNVIPASNSVLAKSLFKLGHYFENKIYTATSKQMLNNIKKDMEAYGSGYANWLQLYADFCTDFYEIAVVGKNAKEKIKELNQQYIPNKLIAGSLNKSDEPLLQYRYQENETLIYICIDGACKLPVASSKKALTQLKIDIK
ncbi:thioredoxin domain-containing protein [Flavicella sediminum]|uniref:thioredoxin domain-containing protein n=1 Tax=Flavicella sediminum TaxID=2585141 RepID=UPI001FB7CED1|nr:thioredoxin domain-containing protein [Flavicella sediminum]